MYAGHYCLFLSLLPWIHVFTDIFFVSVCVFVQHIEDLTQEKFSLQRALESSRVLAESLAAENSSLTDNYNQQVGSKNSSVVSL